MITLPGELLDNALVGRVGIRPLIGSVETTVANEGPEDYEAAREAPDVPRIVLRKVVNTVPIVA